VPPAGAANALEGANCFGGRVEKLKGGAAAGSIAAALQARVRASLGRAQRRIVKEMVRGSGPVAG